MVRGRAIVAVGVLVTLLAVACSDGGGSGGLLRSRETFEGDGFRVDYPEDWEVVEGGRYGADSVVEFVRSGDDDSGGLQPHVRVARRPNVPVNLGDMDSVALSVTSLIRPEVTDLEVANQQEADVQGAESAVTMNLAYADDFDGGEVDVRELMLVAVPPSETVTVVRFIAPAEEYEDLKDTFAGLAENVQVQ